MKYDMTRSFFLIEYFYNKTSTAFNASGTIVVTIVTECAIMSVRAVL